MLKRGTSLFGSAGLARPTKKVNCTVKYNFDDSRHKHEVYEQKIKQFDYQPTEDVSV